VSWNWQVAKVEEKLKEAAVKLVVSEARVRQLLAEEVRASAGFCVWLRRAGTLKCVDLDAC
jgi:ABC-type Zn uptake system ZnuABC Zn-binding protein ZnuA